MSTLMSRTKDVIVHRVLGLEDTPHRIAWGVFLGCMVTFTPTIGLQIVIYLTVATLLRANKVSGVPILFLSNPLSAVPLYWGVWKVGQFLLHLGHPPEVHVRELLTARLESAGEASEGSLLEKLLEPEFWSGVGDAMLQMGGELWLGSLVIGLLTGTPAYFFTVWAVKTFRARLSRDGGGGV